MASDWWERDEIHHFEYDQPEPWPDMDAFTVAKAIDGLELSRLKAADVIAMARDRLSKMLLDIPGTHYEEAKGLTENLTYVYDWGGKYIRRVQP